MREGQNIPETIPNPRLRFEFDPEETKLILGALAVLHGMTADPEARALHGRLGDALAGFGVDVAALLSPDDDPLALAGALFEALAAIEHERWADWQRYLHSRGYRLSETQTIKGTHGDSTGDSTGIGAEMPTGSLVISVSHVMRWERQIATPYADLSEAEKESDREQVRRYWPLIEGLL